MDKILLCGCCAVALAHDDQSGCRDFHGHRDFRPGDRVVLVGRMFWRDSDGRRNGPGYSASWGDSDVPAVGRLGTVQEFPSLNISVDFDGDGGGWWTVAREVLALNEPANREGCSGMAEIRVIGEYSVEFSGDVFRIIDREWGVVVDEIRYCDGALLDPASGNVFPTDHPWEKVRDMIGSLEEHGISFDDFGGEVDQEDCESCEVAAMYHTHGRCFNHELEEN